VGHSGTSATKTKLISKDAAAAAECDGSMGALGEKCRARVELELHKNLMITSLS